MSNVDVMDEKQLKAYKSFEDARTFDPIIDLARRSYDLRSDLGIGVTFDQVGANWAALNGDEEEIGKLLSPEPALGTFQESKMKNDQDAQASE